MLPPSVMAVTGSVFAWFTGSNEVGSELQVALKGVGHVPAQADTGSKREHEPQFLTVAVSADAAISPTNWVALSHPSVIWLVELTISDLEISVRSIFP